MLLDIIKILVEHGYEKEELYQLILNRAKRYASIQERLISPEGTFTIHSFRHSGNNCTLNRVKSF